MFPVGSIRPVPDPEGERVPTLDLSPVLPAAADPLTLGLWVLALAPAALMLLAAWPHRQPASAWRALHGLGVAALIATMVSLGALATLAWQGGEPLAPLAGLKPTLLGALVAVLVQGLGVVLGRFSARYLQGEPQPVRYVQAFAAVLAAVQLLLLADHWVVLIAAWAAVGVALERLLCFYGDRPFAVLAARKKRLADRAADVLLLAAAALAWSAVGSGSFTALFAHLETQGAGPALQLSAVLLALAVVLRTALLPVHGWLIQVMEAPTPVSALLHAGVVNLGGFVLIRLSPLWEQAIAARGLLVVLGLATAVLAALVMMTRISIKVRLAWSTTAQMGFMILELGLGLTTLALLHLIGHSLYKSHAFLSSSEAVRSARLHDLRGTRRPGPAAWHGGLSVLLAPLAASVVVMSVAFLVSDLMGWTEAPWPVWWSVVLGLAFAPLWWPVAMAGADDPLRAVDGSGAGIARALGLTTGLTAAAVLLHGVVHALPMRLSEAPHDTLGGLAVAGMALLYAAQAVLWRRPDALPALHRWAYAGFYLDAFFTRLALRGGDAPWRPVERRAPIGAALPASSVTKV